eukprot:412603-Pyramimonas_sp.AAC.1
MFAALSITCFVALALLGQPAIADTNGATGLAVTRVDTYAGNSLTARWQAPACVPADATTTEQSTLQALDPSTGAVVTSNTGSAQCGKEVSGVSLSNLVTTTKYKLQVTSAGKSVSKEIHAAPSDTPKPYPNFLETGKKCYVEVTKTTAPTNAAVGNLTLDKGARYAVAADFDRDGDLDLYIANDGNDKNGMANLLFMNDGRAGFTQSDGGAATTDASKSRGVIAADLTGDNLVD